ncbi:MAG: Ldh family oxidoreductase [Pseudomonadota bacterium]
MIEAESILIPDAEALLAAAFVASGVPNAAAQSVAVALVAAEAEGQVGHGFSRLADYVAQIESGKIVADAVPALSVRAPASLHVDAGHGLAYPALDLAIEHGARVARDTGVAVVSISRSHHAGALSVQVDRIAQQGLIGLMVANTPAAMAPWGGTTAFYGTNPIAFSAPRAGRPPLVIDLSLSRVARGKIMNAKKTGQPIPEGWALDAQGRPTTDPDAALAGSMVPIGDAKGTALALMVEVLAAAFTGAAGSAAMSSFLAPDGPPPGAGQFLLMIKPQSDGFAARLETLLSQIAAMDDVRLPGDRRLAALRYASAHGLQVPKKYIATAQQIAQAVRA